MGARPLPRADPLVCRQLLIQPLFFPQPDICDEAAAIPVSDRPFAAPSEAS